MDRVEAQLEKLESGVVETGPIAAAIEPAFPVEPERPLGLRGAWQRRVLVAAVTSWTLMAVGTLGITPVFPDIARDLGLKAGAFGALLGISTLVAGILQIPMGVLSDRFRVKYIAAVGLVASATAPAIWALSPNYRIYAIGQFTLGISIVCLQAGFHTAIANAFRDKGRASAMSMLWVATSIGGVASLLLFGELGGRIGWRTVALGIFWLPLLALPLTLTMPDTAVAGARKTLSEIGRDSLRYLVHGRAIALCGLMTLSAGTAFGTQFLIPFVLRSHDYGAGATGLLLVPYILGGLVGSPLIGALADRFGAARPVAVGMFCGAISLAVLAAAGPQPAILVGCFLILGALANGGPAVLLSATADVAAQVAGVGAGSALGITRLALSLGPAVSPTIIGFLFLAAGGTTTEFLLAAVFAVAGIMGIAVLAGLRQAGVHSTPESSPRKAI